MALLLSTCGPGAPQDRGAGNPAVVPRGKLEVGQTHEGSLAASTSDRYEVNLAAEESLLLEVSQHDIDVVVRVSKPDGRGSLLFDSPVGTMAPERACIVSEAPGTYFVEIRPFAGSGHYSLRALHIRPATEADRRCAVAATTFFTALTAENEAERVAGFEGAGRLWEKAGEPLLAAIAWRQAGGLHFAQGVSARAIQHLKRALLLAREAASSRLETSLLNRLGLAYQDAGRLVQAAESLDQALARTLDGADPRGRAAALTNRGRVDEEMGDPHRAVDRYREALEIWRREGEPAEIAQTLDNLASVLGVLDHHDEALDGLGEALQLARRADDLQRQVNILTSIGWIHYLRGDPAQGLPPLREALSLSQAADDRKGEAGVLDRLGTALRAAGNLRDAEQAYRSSLTISEEMELPGYRSSTQTNLGCLLAETGRRREAADFLASAHEYFEGSEDPKASSQVEYCLARLARNAGDGDAALGHVRRALAIVEGLRETAREDGHYYKPIWLWQDYAKLELALLFDRYRSRGDSRDLADAFAAADRMRARTLYELVVSTRAGAEHAAGRALELQAELLRAQLNEVAAARVARLARTEGSRDTAELDAEIRSLRLGLQEIQADTRAAARDAGKLGVPQPVSAVEAQRLLDSQTLLLTYVLGVDRSHLLTLTRDSLDVFELPPRQILEDHAQGLYHALEESRDSYGQWLLAASALGRLLLPPGSVPPGTERLLVAPEGGLYYVPFAVLASPMNRPEGEPGPRLVLDDFEVVTVPSAAVLAALRARRKARPPAPKTVAVFADPIFSTDELQPTLTSEYSGAARRQELPDGEPAAGGDLLRTILAPSLPSGPFPRLPASRQEAEAILARVPPDKRLVFLGHEATKEAVLSADLSSYRILHFATHAWVDERFPELSGLVLSTRDRSGRTIDGALYLHEIDRLNLNAQLTVLSGCQTALGQRVPGDGLLGLTQGFFHAGSSQVLVSLWSLDDTASARLIAEFYRRMLDGGETPAAALRNSQQWLRAQGGFEAPRYWAPFVLQGDG